MDALKFNEQEFRVALARRGLRQWQAAAGAGVSPSVLCAIVRGRRPATPDLMARLAKVLRVRPADLAQR